MCQSIRARYFWPGMYEDIRRWCASYLVCAKRKPPQPTRNGQLIPIKTSYLFEIVAIDITGTLRKTPRGNKYILICIDLFTNWVEAIPLKTETAEEVANGVFDLIISRHGCPSKILTDKGTNFTSELFKFFCKRLGITKLQTSVLHPQTNGKAERFNRF
jgi:transposase InsO family protein